MKLEKIAVDKFLRTGTRVESIRFWGQPNGKTTRSSLFLGIDVVFEFTEPGVVVTAQVFVELPQR